MARTFRDPLPCLCSIVLLVGCGSPRPSSTAIEADGRSAEADFEETTARDLADAIDDFLAEGPADAGLDDLPAPDAAAASAATETGADDAVRRDEILAVLDELRQRRAAADRRTHPAADPVPSGDVEWLEDSEDSADAALPAAGSRTADRASLVDPAATDLDTLVVRLSARLAQRARRSEAPLREHLALAALTVLDPARAEQRGDHGHDLMPAEADLLDAYLKHFAAVGRALEEEPGAVEPVADAIDDLARAAAAGRGLAVPHADFARSVTSFGHYEAVEQRDFIRGNPQQVFLYVEVENFRSRRTAEGEYRTRLEQTIEIHTDSDGSMVHAWPALVTEDRCRRLRRDFFLVRSITLPTNLNVGGYTMKVRLRDEQAGTEAETIIPFRIVASHVASAGRR